MFAVLTISTISSPPSAFVSPARMQVKCTENARVM
jgi:hypothetical protein